MSDELDQELLRRFAVAREPLPDAQFHAHVMARLRRPYGWRGMPHLLASAFGAIQSGFISAMSTLFRRRLAGLGLMAIVMGATAGLLALLSA